jgi:signal transduction histidine kinase
LKEKAAAKDMVKVERPIEAIQDIIEQIRHWEAIESGKQPLQLESVSVKEVLNFVLDIFEDKVRQKDLKLNISMNDSNPIIQANKSTLQSQIFSNILSNAIKF